MNGEGRQRRLDWGRSDGGGRGRGRGRGRGEGACLLTLARVLKEGWVGGQEGACLLTVTRVSYVF